MPRLKNWPSRFAALEASVRLRPFEWGVHDCCLWAADAVLALTGADPAAAWRGTYRTQVDAMTLVVKLGGLASIGALGGKQISPSVASTGDVGLVRWPDRTRSLAVRGAAGWLCAGEAGLVTIEASAALGAWGVGHG